MHVSVVCTHTDVHTQIQHVTAEQEPVFLRQAKEFLFFSIMSEEVSQ
jgi:hypothetical protein